MDNSKDWGEFLEGIKAAQQATEAQKEANEQHEKYERLRFEFTLALINNNDLLHERSFKEICQLGVELTDEFTKHESEKGPKIPKSKMGIIIKELKAMFPAADGKQIADLVKSCVV